MINTFGKTEAKKIGIGYLAILIIFLFAILVPTFQLLSNQDQNKIYCSDSIEYTNNFTNTTNRSSSGIASKISPIAWLGISNFTGVCEVFNMIFILILALTSRIKKWNCIFILSIIVILFRIVTIILGSVIIFIDCPNIVPSDQNIYIHTVFYYGLISFLTNIWSIYISFKNRNQEILDEYDIVYRMDNFFLGEDSR
jgi:hypothetical protein